MRRYRRSRRAPGKGVGTVLGITLGQRSPKGNAVHIADTRSHSDRALEGAHGAVGIGGGWIIATQASAIVRSAELSLP